MSNFAAETGMLVADLGEAVLECSDKIVVTRFGKSTRNKGRSGKPFEETFDALVSVQALNQKERNALPEGTRAQGRVKVYSTVELRTIDTSECKLADRFIYEGVNYVVERVDNWESTGGYFRMEATRLDR